MMRSLVVVLAVAALSACAPTTQGPRVDKADMADEIQLQRELYWEMSRENFARINRVFLPLSIAAMPMCPQSRIEYDYGFTFLVYADVDKRLRAAAGKLEKLGRYPKAVHVLPQSGADKAGLRVGDELLEISDHPMSGEEGSSKIIQDITKEFLDDKKPLAMTVLRGGESLNLTVKPEPFCAFPPVLMEGEDAVNALADGKRIVLTGGMIRFVHSDEELALIVAHELAHNLKGHMFASQMNRMAGSFIGAMLGSMVGLPNTMAEIGARAGDLAYSRDFEAEADYIGLYLMARAGMAIDSAPELWRRMGTLSLAGISHGITHPPTAYRFAALKATIAEINRKRAEGRELMPNLARSGAERPDGIRPDSDTSDLLE